MSNTHTSHDDRATILRWLGIALCGALLVTGCNGSSDPSAESEPTETPGTPVVEVGYSGCSCGPLWEALVEAYTDEHDIVFNQLGKVHCADAVDGVAEGILDLACVGSYPDRVAVDDTLVFAPISHDALAVAVSPDVGIEGLTREELREIYSGACTNWSQLGGFDQDIWVADRELSRSSRPVAEHEFLGVDLQVREDAVVLAHEEEVVDFVSSQHGAIGYFSLGLVGHVDATVNVLEVDGIAPTPENVRSGAYSAVRHRGFVVAKDAPAELLAFIEWAGGEEAGQIVDSLGYLSSCGCAEVGASS